MRQLLNTIAGLSLGLLLTQSILFGYASWSDPRRVPFSGPIISESKGRIGAMVIHYTAGSVEVSGNIFRSFFAQFDPGAKITLVVKDEAAKREFFQVLGERIASLHQFKTIEVGHELTTWSRDRWISRRPLVRMSIPAILSDWMPSALPLVIAPRSENLAETWTERAADGLVARDLHRLTRESRFFYSHLLFDGGDFVADDQTVFVTPDVIRRNLGVSVKDEAELQAKLEQVTGLPTILLPDAPEHHAGMFMMLVGERRAIVADPRDGVAHLDQTVGAEQMIPEGVVRDESVFAKYDAVAHTLSQHGYQVTRIPALHTGKYKAYISYTNVIMDQTPTGPVVYLPVYSALPELNAAAAQVWKSAGFEVRPVDVSQTYTLGGTLHCLVNVLSRLD